MRHQSLPIKNPQKIGKRQGEPLVSLNLFDFFIFPVKVFAGADALWPIPVKAFVRASVLLRHNYSEDLLKRMFWPEDCTDILVWTFHASKCTRKFAESCFLL